MEFGGLQKLTLLDFPGRVACTVFTRGCNLRCPFCHNATLVLRPGENLLTEEELFAFLEKRRGVLEGVALTGGEPLMHPFVPEFFRRVRDLGYATKLDTNGCYPDALAALLDEGLVDYVAMDVKNAPERYGAAVGLAQFDLSPVLRSVSLLREERVPCEFRTTVVRGIHTEADLVAIARWLGDVPHYYLQRFVDSGDLISAGGAFSPAEMRDLLSAVRRYTPRAELRGVD